MYFIKKITYEPHIYEWGIFEKGPSGSILIETCLDYVNAKKSLKEAYYVYRNEVDDAFYTYPDGKMWNNGTYKMGWI